MADGRTETDAAPERTQAERAPPQRTAAERDRALLEANDTAALNGGPARHWFEREAAESLETPRRGAKLGVSLVLWGTLAVGLLMLAALL